MTILAAGKVNYRTRIERAALLAERHAFAREILSFYSSIAQFQRELYEALPKRWGKKPVVPAGGDLRSELNLSVLLEPFAEFLKLIEAHAPQALVEESRNLRSKGSARQAEILQEFWKTGLLETHLPVAGPSEPPLANPFEDFFARAMLQPYADFVTGAMLPPAPLMTVCRCPRCNALPVLGVLRPEGDGGKRFLVCSFCSLEWEFRRILCANCGEEKEQQLPVYAAEQFPHIRVESCDTCKHFLRTIDLTKDGNAIPVVDDLTAVPLSLWAEEHGYTRIQGNLLGT
ncbi:MAG TPA: formate dehydrogenase accessory protein FdhE [Candidatus Acidoferrum sp.]|jgi:formate dehydrogenase maturation protein FdhE|nr:formate dehydrogenase accessory protein FdhE [Candidatus Acidoferrum sp.]